MHSTVVKNSSTALLWILSLGIALASWRFMIWGVEVSMNVVAHQMHVRPVALYAHLIFAPIALAMAPFQLWAGLRTRNPATHRLLGRIYAVAILLSSTSGAWLAATTKAGPVAAWGFGALAVVWFITTACGIVLAMQRDIPGHRRWMIRSVSATMAAVTLRIYLAIVAISGFDFSTAYSAIAWLCWVPNLIVAELIIRKRLT